MSFNRLSYDTKAYKQEINQSVSPGIYQMNKPPVSCEQCYPYPPSVRLQKQGNSIDKKNSLIDIDSELMGITRKLSKVPGEQYVPCCPNAECKGGYPCGQGVAAACKAKGEALSRGSRPQDANLHHWKDCFIPKEHCRLSNPPCTLRGTGWNRFEWLCLDPQERVLIPFDHNINNRIIVKDNHRPCIPTPIDPQPSLPRGGKLPCDPIASSICGNPTQPPSVHWRTSSEIQKY